MNYFQYEIEIYRNYPKDFTRLHDYYQNITNGTPLLTASAAFFPTQRQHRPRVLYFASTEWQDSNVSHGFSLGNARNVSHKSNRNHIFATYLTMDLLQQLGVATSYHCGVCRSEYNEERYPVVGRCGHSLCHRCHVCMSSNCICGGCDGSCVDAKRYDCPIIGCPFLRSHTKKPVKNHSLAKAVIELAEVKREVLAYKERTERAHFSKNIEHDRLAQSQGQLILRLNSEKRELKRRLRVERTLQPRETSYHRPDDSSSTGSDISRGA